ncbi:MAG: MobA/MobL family protein [Fusobacteriaceae bacterium]|nr:MobA/MobL family protein [Fusobacteriaceae bacterium]
MAEYRMCYKKGKPGYAENHAKYILREGKYNSKEDLIHKESGNIEVFNGNLALDFWAAADQFERVNSNAYREFELNIPNELNHTQAVELMNGFIDKELKKTPYTYAIHESNNNGIKNLHCHLMFSERENDGIERPLSQYFKRANEKNPEKGGAKKNPYYKQKMALIEFRKKWEIEQNNFFKKYDIDAKVDSRSLRNRKKEAIENNDIVMIEILDRNPVNCNKKIINKTKHKGLEALTEKEKIEYDKYQETKKIKYNKESILLIKKGIITPEKKDCINRLEYLNKKEPNVIALNIMSNGNFSKLQKKIDTLKINFNDINAFEIIKEDSNIEIKKIEQLKDTKKYKQLIYFINEDIKQEKQMFSNILKNNYKVDYLSLEDNLKYNPFRTNKLYDRLNKLTLEKLKYRLKEISYEDNHLLAKNIITNYREESLKSNYISISEQLKDKEKFYKSYKNENLINEIKELKSKQEFIEKQWDILNKFALKNKDRIDAKEKDLNYESKKEKEIIENLITEKTHEQNKNLNILSMQIKNNIYVEKEYMRAVNLYKYFSKNNTKEKYSKNLYKLQNRIEIFTKERKELQIYMKNIPKDKFIKELNNNIKEKEETILKIKGNINKLELASNNMNILLNDQVIEKLTINKLSTGKFMINFKEKNRINEKINKLNIEYSSLNKFDLLKRNNINKEIKKLTEEYNKHNSITNELTEFHKKTENYAKIFKEVKDNFEKARNKIFANVRLEKRKEMECDIEIEISKNIKNYKQQQSKINNIISKINKSKGGRDKLKEVLCEITNNDISGYSNWEINLNKERDREW